MNDWLTIESEKANDSDLKEFIQANPVLDKTMRALLDKHLKLSEPSLEEWIQKFQHKVGEYPQLYIVQLSIIY